MIKNIAGIFRLRRGERLPALIALLLMAALNGMVIARYFDLFTQTGRGRWTVFVRNFTISGFDPITYSVITGWDTSYNVYRHPLLAFMVWPLSVLDNWLTELTGMNTVQILCALPLLFCGVYSFIFLLRILRDVVRVPRYEATVLTAMFFSFAYIMITLSVPDHFCVSMFLLMLTFYITGRRQQENRRLTKVQTVLLFVLTAGVTLSNGIKTFICALMTNRGRFFRPGYLLLAVLLPSALMWGFARWEYRTYVLPKEKARHEAKVRKSQEEREKAFIQYRDTTAAADSAVMRHAFDSIMRRKAVEKYRADHKKPWNKHTGTPMGKGEFMRWTDVSTSRWQTAVENLFGESMQLHRDHLLEDTLRSRPVIVPYRWTLSYVVEAVVALLFVIGVWCGRRSRFLWTVLLCFAFDMTLHMGLGFGINEVYIMAAHWMPALPVAMGYMARGEMSRTRRIALRVLLTVLTLYLFIYNFTIYAGYLL